MKKDTWFYISLMLICMVLTACREKSAPLESEVSVASLSSTEVVPSESEMSEVNSSLSEISSGKVETEEDSTSNLTSDPTHLIWTVGLMPYITNEARGEIKRFLHEKGIECEIEFVDVEGGAAYKKWYEQQKQKNEFPDILAVSPWEYGIYDAVAFIRSELIPLNDYLDTKVGKKLLDSYCDIEWKQLTINEKIYTIPKRMRQRPYDLYIYINDRFKEKFEASFDGSYESLRKIFEESEGQPIIASDSLGVNTLCPFLGYNFKNALFYDMNLEVFDDLTAQKRLKELLQEVYSDMLTGRFVSWASSNILSENVMAYISSNQPDASFAGYTQYVLSPYRFMVDPGAFGVCKSSSKQELAFRVLSTCFSDPEIASLIGYGEVSVEEWNKETEIIKSGTMDDRMAGFFPEILNAEVEQLHRTQSVVNSLISNMITSRDSISGIGIVNPNFPDILESYSADLEDNSEIYDKINQQLEEWTKDHDY